MMKDTFIFQILQILIIQEEKNADQSAYINFVPTDALDGGVLCVTFHVAELSFSWDLISFHNNLSTSGFKMALFW